MPRRKKTMADHQDNVGIKSKKIGTNSGNQETEIHQSDVSNDRQETDNSGCLDVGEQVQHTDQLSVQYRGKWPESRQTDKQHKTVDQSSLQYQGKLPESKQMDEQHKTVNSQTGLLAHVPEVVTDYAKQKESMLKVVTTKTFNKGLMDISLLTSNATQLREVILHPGHPFYSVVLCLISVSIILQVSSTLLMLTSDYLKGSAKDSSSNLFRKKLSYITMALISLVTVLNVLISVFHIPGGIPSPPAKVS